MTATLRSAQTTTVYRPLSPTAQAACALLTRVWNLPPTRNRVRLARSLNVPMRDGTILLADHYAPVTTESRPTVLLRSPYGRGVQFGLMVAQPYAARGYHVLLQSARGTFGSGGEFRPGADEAADGQDTVAWLRTQDWFDGRLATLGASYLGFVQWALALDPPPELKASIVHVGPHDMAASGVGRGVYELYNLLMWSELMARQEHVSPARAVWRTMNAGRRLAPSLERLPLSATGDILGHASTWYHEWTRRPDVADPYWDGMRANEALQRLNVPTLLLGGFHDFFAEQTLHQYRTLRERGVEVGLTFGEWHHMSVPSHFTICESLAWLDAYVAGDGPAPRKSPTSVWVGGAREWRDLPHWPPAGTEPRSWYLSGTGRLAESKPAETSPDDDAGQVTSLRYDPLDPTPSVGGRIMSLTGGSRDNRRLEARADVLTFTGSAFGEPVEALGTPLVELYVSTDNPSADVFVRLCDVDRRGRSWNLTDQIVRLSAAPGVPGAADLVRFIEIPLVDLAHRFLPGHRVRLQISAGAFPRFARNPGTGEPDHLAAETRPTTLRIHHGPETPSRLVLPVQHLPAFEH